MDIDYQDEGMLKAFGLVYRLLQNEITVYWIINPDKVMTFTGAPDNFWRADPDFFADAVDIETAEIITNHAYRGGPFVIDLAQAADALPIIEGWHVDGHVTTVHQASASFEGVVSKEMVVAPTIGVFADGNEKIAFGYLNAAGIPDSNGLLWDDDPMSADGLTRDDIRGLTDVVHNDGALFDEDGYPVYCQLMSMHWGVKDRENPVVRRSWPRSGNSSVSAPTFSPNARQSTHMKTLSTATI